MTSVHLSINGSIDLFQVLIDDKTVLTGSGGGSQQVECDAGEHVVTWFVRGAPGSTYALELSEPGSASFRLEGTVGLSGKDGGVRWVTIEDDR